MKGNGKSYTSNVDDTFNDAEGGEIRVKVGDTFTGLDDGTARFLIGQGKISEGKTAGLGTAQTETPAASGHIETMSRRQLLDELASGMSDDQLREALDRKRKHEAEEGASLLAGASPGSGEPDADAFDAATFVDRTLDAITDDELAKLTVEQRTAVRAAEDAGQKRKGLLDRLDELDKPPEA